MTIGVGYRGYLYTWCAPRTAGSPLANMANRVRASYALKDPYHLRVIYIYLLERVEFSNHLGFRSTHPSLMAGKG